MTLKELTEAQWRHDCAKTSMRPDYVPKTKFTDKTANGLEKAVCAFIKLQGYQAERIKNTGRVIDNTKTFTDAVGFTRRIGSVEYIKGTGTNGTSDISATIKGMSVKIEIKIGKDRQSEAQKIYQANIERAGGKYFIVHTFEEFINHYNSLFL